MATTRSASVAPSSASALASSSAVDASLFPLKSISDVVNFFRRSLEQWSSQGTEPDLTLLSIVAGYIELSLTTGDAAVAAAAAASAEGASANVTTAQNADIIMGNSVPFPVVTHELVSGLYKKFQSILGVVEKPKASQNRQATREVIKKVSDVIWHSLIRSSYKDRAHLQNLYSFLSANKLDCFGVSFAVVAGCQLLGYRDVHLAIAEDHAWVVFGSPNKTVETIEVTWHGKGAEDKRGQDINAGIESGSWLYLGGLAVMCDRAMEVAAIVSAINISLTANSDCVEVAELQQQLLWVLYDMQLLQKYPMALGTLGEMEEINPTVQHKHIGAERLYHEAIQSARDHYQNHHVYPYTYTGNYYNRLLRYREAFDAWANAADVIRLYTYNCRDDEEIYKELLEIANEMIPYVMKLESSGHSARSILRDSEVFANLLRFYDGICQWEEHSPTPILHIGWAKPLVNNITKFDYDIRSQVVIRVLEDEQFEVPEAMGKKPEQDPRGAPPITQLPGLSNAGSSMTKREEKLCDGKKVASEIPTTLADLTAACGQKILNPDFLLQGGGQPFAEHHQNNHNNHQTEAKKNERKEGTATDGNSVPMKPKGEATSSNKRPVGGANSVGGDMQVSNKKDRTGSNTKNGKLEPSMKSTATVLTPSAVDHFEFMLKRPIITLYSQKMKGLKDLLLAEKLNTHAISLQVTAQSVAHKKVRGIDKMGNHTTNSIYATVNVTGAAGTRATLDSSGGTVALGTQQTTEAAITTAAPDSIAASRPKRSRRE